MDERFLTIRSAREASRRRVIDAPASAAWDLPDLAEPKIHRIHGYPAKFPAFLTTRALEYARRQGLRPQRVADVFCGCGTVAFEARRAGLDFWGCDVNPVATLIARTKSGRFSSSRIRQYCEDILAAMPQSDGDPGLSDTAVARLNAWFAPQQFANLARLRNAIQTAVPAKSAYRSVLLCAFSAILKGCSQWRQRAIKPAFDRFKLPDNVAEAFRTRCATIADAFNEPHAGKATQVEIHLADILTVKPPCDLIDLIVTSPPYVTSYEYADLHQLSSLWLGYADDYRDLRKGSIGSSKHDLNFNRSFNQLNRVANQVVFSLFNEDRQAARAVANYYLDMQAVARRCYEFLSPQGAAVFVIGNTKYCGVEIDNASHLAESLFDAGFQRVRVTRRQISNKAATPFRTESGRFSRDATSNQIYSHEFILIAHP